MRRVDLTSTGFLLLEKRETPMHVGGVNLFSYPKGVNKQSFLEDVVERLRDCRDFRKPFGEYAATRRTGQYWETDEHIDMDYHVRHSALPSPGRYRELFALTSRLHTTLLDRTRPLWEVHVIEGVLENQFAIYNKIHHAAIDGVGGIQITQAMCTRDPRDKSANHPFSQASYEALKSLRPPKAKPIREVDPASVKRVLEVLKEQYDSGINLATAARRFGMAFFGRSGNLAVPWHNVPRTSINTRVSGARRFVAQSFAFERVRKVCKSLDATVNDIVLAMCAGALRRYLLTRDELPLHSLKAMAPVSIREEGDIDSANAVGFITADMATNIYDPEKRLRAIQASMRAGKGLMRELSTSEAALFTQLTQLPALITSILGIGARFPAFSTVVSNVPGPREQLYWNGARLDGMYPASIVFDGFAMNITLISYNDNLDFGIIACRRSLPQIQRMIDHLEDSLAELEEIAGVNAARSNAPQAAKPRNPRLAASKAKSSPTKKTAAKRTRGVTKPGKKSSPLKTVQTGLKSKTAPSAKKTVNKKKKQPAKTKARPSVRPKLKTA
ncbi:MAG: wax ester/triacylglycerol synthase family O-acyltransferase [Pseudomonadota bacterium]